MAASRRLVAIVLDPLCQLVDLLLRANSDCKMSEPHALGPWLEGRGCERGRVHRFDACAVGEGSTAVL